MNYLFFFVFVLTILFLSCYRDDNKDMFCYSFDPRSCATDVWIKDQRSFTNAQELLKTIESFLREQDIGLQGISIDGTFHEFSCDACHVCPDGSRVYIRATREVIETLVQLDLLNLEMADCSHID